MSEELQVSSETISRLNYWIDAFQTGSREAYIKELCSDYGVTRLEDLLEGDAEEILEAFQERNEDLI